MTDSKIHIQGTILPLSPVQQGMFFHHIHEKNKNYLEQLICEINGDLDVGLFEKTLNRMVELYDSLRTLFLYKGLERMQQVILDQKAVYLDYRDVSQKSNNGQIVDKCIKVEAEKNFDLSKETCRSKLFKVGEKKYIYLCTYHHLILDSWTIKLFEEGFSKIYYHEKEGLPFNQEQYSYQLYVDWIDAQDQDKARTYWRKYLGQYAHKGVHQSPKVDKVHQRKTLEVEFAPESRKLIGEISEKYRVTLSTAVMAAWGIFALDHYQKEEILFGCVTFGRLIGLKNVDKIAGLFVNSIPMYIKRDSTQGQLVANLQKDTFRSAGYSYLSLSDIMACGDLRPGDIHTFLNFYIDSEEINNEYADKLPFRIENIRYNEQANYEVYLDVYLQEEGFKIRVYYDTEKYHFDVAEIQGKISQILEFLSDQPELLVRDMLNQLILDEKMDAEASFDF